MYGYTGANKINKKTILALSADPASFQHHQHLTLIKQRLYLHAIAFPYRQGANSQSDSTVPTFP